MLLAHLPITFMCPNMYLFIIHACVFAGLWLPSPPAAVGRMQAEGTDSSLREGIEALGVSDSEKPAAGKEEEGNTHEQDTEMTAATEEDTTTRDETGNSIKKHNSHSLKAHAVHKACYHSGTKYLVCLCSKYVQ